MHYFLLFLTGLLAGGINSVAGGGIFVVLPALLLSGLTGKQSNASGSFAVWVGQTVSLYQNRKLLPKSSALIRQIIIICLVGSIVGALLLIATPNINFEQALPWLNAAATLIFIGGPWLRGRIAKKKAPAWAFPLFLLAVGIYGGYFGGGLGMLMLAVLGIANTQDVKHNNALKLLTASIINATSLAILVFAQLIIWRFALPAGLGALVGGYAGAHFSMRLPSKAIRALVICIGIATTIYLFIHFA